MHFPGPRLKDTSLEKEWKLLKFVWKAAGRYHFQMIAGLVIQLALGLFPAWFVYKVQDSMSASSSDLMKLVNEHNAFYVLLAITAYMLLKKGSGIIINYASIGVERNIRDMHLKRIMNLPASYVWMHMDRRGAMGITVETQMVGELIPMVYRSFLRAPAAMAGALALMIAVSPRFVGIVLAMLAVITLASVLLRKSMKRLRRQTYDAISMLYNVYNDWLEGYRLLKVYGCVNFMRDRMSALFDSIASLSRRSSLIGATQSFIIEAMTYAVAVAFIIFVTGTGNAMTLGIVISFPAAIVLIRNEAIYISSGYQQLAYTESSISRLMQVLGHPGCREHSAEWHGRIDYISLLHVEYAYPGEEKTVLKDVTATFGKGKPNVIMGQSGAGKSTLINIVLGLLRPCSGIVAYNGDDISSFNSASLLDKTAIVEQTPFIFDGTLWDNIAIGRSLRRDYVESLFRLFNLQYLLDTPAGLDAAIGTDNRILSPGEKQRISIIRALADDPDVLILDEITSSIDLDTSRVIIERISSLADKKLVICVSHDLVWRETDARYFLLLSHDKSQNEKQFREYGG